MEPVAIEMNVVGVRVELPTNQPLVLLREREGERFLPILIGAPEATAIAFALQGIVMPRPTTHDLMRTMLEDLGVAVDRIVITNLKDGTFFAQIEMTRDGTAYSVSSRPSDAIALAVRASVPVFAAPEVLDEVGIEIKDEDVEGEVQQFREFIDNVAPEDFGRFDG